MSVPTDRWTAGGWNSQLPQLHRLAEALGAPTPPKTQDDLQALFPLVAAKVFADNVQAYIDASTGLRGTAADLIENIERKLGTTEMIPFMSMEGITDPTGFEGVAIWPSGVANWIDSRLGQIELAVKAGARIKHIVCLNSPRVCEKPADRRHPAIRNIQAGQEPTERQLQRWLADQSPLHHSLFRFPELPEVNDEANVLSLEQQLQHLQASGQYDELIGGADIYVPSTPNSLYVPLHVRRVLGHDNVWFSQAGARAMRVVPDFWWPNVQDVMTLPNGMLRLWVELLHAGCITA